ncbi:DUF418 domain-containing protein [Lysobacter sp. D1-1-M9]|uniref:DUF418 domain-containing protein n=1 Tax=Novilysobacter longmucuonensis TaxID=3098603 RepID=UPI002FC77617
MTSSGERLGVLDFVRGIAVLGIFVINIESFAFADAFSPSRFGFSTDLDRDFRFWTYFLFQGKFFALFALLFGVGFYLFLEGAAKYGRQGVDLYAHRMLWLFVFGVLHAYLLWPGDILYHYAVCGLLLLPARSLRVSQLAACVVALVVLLGWQSVASTNRLLNQQAEYEHAVATPAAERDKLQLDVVARWEERHSPRAAETEAGGGPRLGGYASNVAANFESVDVWKGQIYYRGILFRTLLLMLSGILLYRIGIFHEVLKLKGYWSITAGMLAVGLTANYSRHWAWTYEYFSPVTSYIPALGHHFSKEILGIAYLLVLNGIYQKYLHRLSFNPLASVGRMALTNYLFQSVAAGFIFYGYGFGLFGSIGRSELWPLVLAVWTVQLVLSVVWLHYFRQGPMEALWRWLMYSTAIRRQGEKCPS